MKITAGEVVALLAVETIVVVALLTRQSVFSPGRLAIPAHVQSIASCGSCHPAPWQPDTMASRCLGCHDDVRQAMLGPAPGHNGVSTAQPDRVACRSCHRGHV